MSRIYDAHTGAAIIIAFGNFRRQIAALTSILLHLCRGHEPARCQWQKKRGRSVCRNRCATQPFGARRTSLIANGPMPTPVIPRPVRKLVVGIRFLFSWVTDCHGAAPLAMTSNYSFVGAN